MTNFEPYITTAISVTIFAINTAYNVLAYYNVREGRSIGKNTIHKQLIYLSSQYRKFWRNLFVKDEKVTVPKIFTFAFAVVITALFVVSVSLAIVVSDYEIKAVTIGLILDLVLIPSSFFAFLTIVRLKAYHLVTTKKWGKWSTSYYLSYKLSPGYFLMFSSMTLGLIIALIFLNYVGPAGTFPITNTIISLGPFLVFYIILWSILTSTMRYVEFIIFNENYTGSPIDIEVKYLSRSKGYAPTIKGSIHKMDSHLYLKDDRDYIHRVRWKNIKEIAVKSK